MGSSIKLTPYNMSKILSQDLIQTCNLQNEVWYLNKCLGPQTTQGGCGQLEARN